MAYSPHTRKAILDAPKTLGNQLGRWASAKNFSVMRVTRCTGATRQTVYNWFLGGDVSPAYRDDVVALINILRTAANTEDAWTTACKKFNRVA